MEREGLKERLQKSWQDLTMAEYDGAQVGIKVILSPVAQATSGGLLSEGKLVSGGDSACNSRQVKSKGTAVYPDNVRKGRPLKMCKWSSEEWLARGLRSPAWREQVKHRSDMNT